MTRKQRRAILIGTGIGVLSFAAILMLFALRDRIVFFHTPSDVIERTRRSIRLASAAQAEGW
jgi:cytochrome c-type biogenesis protein CcmE